MPFIGVRDSWLTVATTSDLSRDDSSARAVATGSSSLARSTARRLLAVALRARLVGGPRSRRSKRARESEAGVAS